VHRLDELAAIRASDLVAEALRADASPGTRGNHHRPGPTLQFF